jgi:hypothetical protein
LIRGQNEKATPERPEAKAKKLARNPLNWFIFGKMSQRSGKLVHICKNEPILHEMTQCFGTWVQFLENEPILTNIRRFPKN